MTSQPKSGVQQAFGPKLSLNRQAPQGHRLLLRPMVTLDAYILVIPARQWWLLFHGLPRNQVMPSLNIFSRTVIPKTRRCSAGRGISRVPYVTASPLHAGSFASSGWRLH